MKLRRILLLMIGVLTILLPLTNTKAQSTYLNYFPLVYLQEQPETNPQNRSDSLNWYQTDYLIQNPPLINWSGSHTRCDPGTTSQAFQDAVLTRINYFRAMAGVPADVTFSEESNRKAQAAAFLMSVNGALSHNPPTTWTCYSTLAHEGASSSNLFLGVYGWDAITGYMKDPGAGNDAVGHRRWILYPQTQTMGSGDIPPVSGYNASNALLVFDEHLWEPRPETRDGFVAWPPPGYVPYPVVFTRWSFSYPDADFSRSTVSMREEGKLLTISVAPVVVGFGENTLVWQIKGMDSGQNWPRPNQDTRYSISINNVIVNGQTLDFSYEVIIFDPNQ
ncbi:MAG: CAP domain-containing protein [Brevefilum sp.]|nr:CAP domain-containing protein [Brevefilum sp.]